LMSSAWMSRIGVMDNRSTQSRTATAPHGHTT
jgi:hypothetical protein